MQPYLWIRNELFTRLVSRFKLRQIPDAPDQVPLLTTVIPVISVDETLFVPLCDAATKAVTTATEVTMFTVPLGERWHLHNYWFTLSSGNFTVDYILYATSNNIIPFHIWASTTSGVEVLPQEIILEAGWLIRICINSFTTAGTITMRIGLSKEYIDAV